MHLIDAIILEGSVGMDPSGSSDVTENFGL